VETGKSIQNYGKEKEGFWMFCKNLRRMDFSLQAVGKCDILLENKEMREDYETAPCADGGVGAAAVRLRREERPGLFQGGAL
jgi:hypothetical protein